jgi:nucleotide-binding universal stress UspA family protein
MSDSADRVLLASEGRAIPAAAVKRAAELARERGGSVHVFSVARVWGTSLGLPNPGLLPTKREWDEQRAVVDDAVKALKRSGVNATGQVLATRKATKRIVREAERLGCTAIVMAADPPRSRLVADLMWSQEPYRVRRRAKVPVHLVTE